MSESRALPASQSVTPLDADHDGRRAAGVVSVLIAVAVRMHRDWLRRTLDGQPGVTVVGAVAELAAVASESVSAPPDVAVVEVGPVADLDALNQLRTRFPNVQIVALISEDGGWDLPAFAAANIGGYVTSDQSAEALIAAVESVAHGEFVCSPRLTFALLQRVATTEAERPPPPAARLTGREREIAGWIERGASNKEIARELCIELATVKNHVHNILFKLDLRRRGEVAAWIRHGRGGQAET